MKQFLYLDTDIVNSIIAQSEKGIITGFSTEEENGEQKSTNKSISGNLEGDAGGKLLKVFNAELKLDIRGGIGTEKEVHSASREIITKTLHDAAFDIAYDSITPVCLTSNGQDQDDYGAYVELTRVFDVVDFDYLERIFSKGGLIEYLKKTEKEKIETTASVATESLNRSQQRSNSNAIRAKIKEAVAASGKQYDGIKEIIDMVRQIIPYNRMLISSDGYLIPLDDRYFRIDAQNLGFKYGGEITCVGMITNIMLMLMCMLMVVVMGMCVIGFFHTIYRNRHMCAGDAALYGRLPAILHTGNAESVQLVHKAIRVRQQLQQCRGQHIACGTHAAIQIQSFHDFASM